LDQFVEKIKHAGRINSLAQTLLKHTAPGVPDLYQGTELWDLSLVDPDNRRPVDYGLRADLLKQMKGKSPANGAAEAMRRIDEGLPKLWTIHHALKLRREKPHWFSADAAYAPLHIAGAKADHAIAHLRADSIATVVPRLTAMLGSWEEAIVTLPEGSWTNRLTGATIAGGTVQIEDLLRDFPVALLVSNS
jgi:(1->4)-alpha-D-glucan 1-alpha-D-glucosylmutase